MQKIDCPSLNRGLEFLTSTLGIPAITGRPERSLESSWACWSESLMPWIFMMSLQFATGIKSQVTLQLSQWLCFNMNEVLQKHIRHHDGTKAFCLLSSTFQEKWKPGASTKRVSTGYMVDKVRSWFLSPSVCSMCSIIFCCSIFTSSKAPPALHGRRQWPKACQLGLPPQGSRGDAPTSQTHMSCMH